MMFYSRVSDCEAHICGQCLINSQQLHDVMKKGRGGSLVSCPVGKVERGMAMPCPREFNRSRNPVLMFVYPVKIEGVHKCMAGSFNKY